MLCFTLNIYFYLVINFNNRFNWFRMSEFILFGKREKNKNREAVDINNNLNCIKLIIENLFKPCYYSFKSLKIIVILYN